MRLTGRVERSDGEACAWRARARHNHRERGPLATFVTPAEAAQETLRVVQGEPEWLPDLRIERREFEAAAEEQERGLLDAYDAREFVPGVRPEDSRFLSADERT